MGLETATYIDQLVDTNPDGTDAKSQGDDHIRLVKKVLQNSFPNITGAVTATQDDLNKTSVVGNFCFPGMIVMWSGAVGSIPSGWKICNGVGTISTGASVPDLRSRFIRGTDGTTPGAIGTTGGSSTIPVNGVTGGTALTVNQIPSHSHQVSYNSTTPDGLDNTGFVNEPRGAQDYPGLYNWETSSVGGSQAHTHSVAISVSSLPPYYSLAFIIKN